MTALRGKLTGAPDTHRSAVDAGAEVARVSARTGRITMTDPLASHADRLLTGREIAIILGISPASWRAYCSQGFAPPPDDADDADGRSKFRRTPRWRVDTIAAWNKARPGQGARTDLTR